MVAPTGSVTEIVGELPRERTWLLPALVAVQRALGHLSPESLEAIAGHLRVPASEVWGVATHYPELTLSAPGRRRVRICTGVSCRISGGLDLLRGCETRLGIRAGEATADGAVSLEEMDCAFQCAIAPVIEVAHQYRGRVRDLDLDTLLFSPLPPETGSTETAPPATTPPAVSTPATTPPATVVAPTGSASRGPSPTARLAALRREAAPPRTGTRIAVGLGTCGIATGAEATYAALTGEVARRRLPLAVVATGCNGMCWASPVVEVLRDGASRVTLSGVRASDVPALVDALTGAAAMPAAVSADVLARQHRVLLDRCGLVDPGDIADAIRHGAYAALARALEDGPDRVIEEVRVAGLAGRGGAYFQTAIKWAGCRAARGSPKFVVVNGEEGEPGIFKDRHLMEGDPHGLLEGMLLAAFAVGASRAILYVHGEAELAATRLAMAVAQAREWGVLGRDVLGTGFSLEVELRRGAGGFVLGEETALLESIEGRRAMPRTRPPFPVDSGLFGQPTVINNVETLCAVPRIVERGGAWFAGLGRGHGTKLFGLSGHLRRPGVVEMEIGCTLRDLVEVVGGGPSTGRPIRAAVVGGPSGSVMSLRQFDEPLIPRGPVSPGTGGVIALDERASVRDAVRTLLAFNTRESCGKCTPCREGTARLLAMLDDGAPDLARVTSLAEVVQLGSLCGLGQAAPTAVLSGLREFPDEFGRVS